MRIFKEGTKPKMDVKTGGGLAVKEVWAEEDERGFVCGND